jgi:hypothetical protein
MIAQMRATFEKFAAKPEVVLIWRPHPLSQEAMAAYALELRTAYTELVKDFKKNNWGIYDTSPNNQRSFYAAHAYYGHKSSVIHLFGVTGKPIMFQTANAETITPQLPSPVFTPSATLADETDLWLASPEFNALLHLSLTSKELSVQSLGAFPGEDLFAKNLYHKPVRAGNKLIFAPNAAKKVAVFNLDTRTFEAQDLPPAPALPANAPPPPSFTAAWSAGGFEWQLRDAQIFRRDPNTGATIEIPLLAHLNATGSTFQFVASTGDSFFLQLHPSLEMLHIRCPGDTFSVGRFYARYGADFPVSYLWGTPNFFGIRNFIHIEREPSWQTIEGMIENLPTLQLLAERQKAMFGSQFANADGTAGAKIFSKLKECISNPLTVPSTGAKAMNGA